VCACVRACVRVCVCVCVFRPHVFVREHISETTRPIFTIILFVLHVPVAVARSSVGVAISYVLPVCE